VEWGNHHENVVGVGALAALVEELEEVVELAVDVATDSDRGRDRLHIGLLNEDFLDLGRGGRIGERFLR